MMFDEDMDDRQVGMPVYLCETCGSTTVCGSMCRMCIGEGLKPSQKKDFPLVFYYMTFRKPMSSAEIAERSGLPRDKVEKMLKKRSEGDQDQGVFVVSNGCGRYSLGGQSTLMFPWGHRANIDKSLWSVEMVDKDKVYRHKIRSSGVFGAIRILVQKTWGEGAFFAETGEVQNGFIGNVLKQISATSFRTMQEKVEFNVSMIRSKRDILLGFRSSHVIEVSDEDGKVVESFRLMAYTQDDGSKVLYTRKEWASASVAEWTLSSDGELLFQGEKAGFYRAGMSIEIRKIRKRK